MRINPVPMAVQIHYFVQSYQTGNKIVTGSQCPCMNIFSINSTNTKRNCFSKKTLFQEEDSWTPGRGQGFGGKSEREG